jgi:hypothetical protein
MPKTLLAIFLLVAVATQGADKKEIISPDGKVKVVVETRDKLYYSVYYENNVLLLPSPIDMVWQNGTSLA